MSDSEYRFSEIERKWQARWAENGLFRAAEDDPRPKSYVLCMYPYPSGVLHMGHVINYTIGDVVVRYKLLRGFKVLSPMGWDSFGLPAENAAIRTGVHPHRFTETNIARMRGQMARAGWGYDWEREVATSHEDYYRWTQWFFLKLYEKGLAFKKTAPVNWCPSCQTVLANEQAEGGSCERCGTAVEQHDMSQWFFAMSRYAQRLLDNHAQLEGRWPESVLKLQKEWIGRSEGARVVFRVAETGDEVPVFTTRPDTLWGVTFLVLAPEHPLVEKLVRGSEHEARVLEAVKGMRAGSLSEKELAEREKVGVPTGFHVVNPVNGERVPLWVANFALMTYGTGAVMSVPAHDQRDFDFARKYGIPIRVVIQPDADEPLEPDSMTEAYTDPGTMVGSGSFDGRRNLEAMPDIIAWLEAERHGTGTVNYKLRDWLVSRQRYWGAPIPIVYCDACGTVAVPEDQLPVRLPTDVEFKAGGGNALATSASFLATTCPRCGGPAERETDTMDTFVDSSWYFLRYCDPRNEASALGADGIREWMPVDQYIGGIEHATMHLIYARFFTMVLHDLGLVDFEEPFARLFCQGMVCKTAYYCEVHKYIPESKVVGGRKEGDAILDGTCADCGSKVTSEMTKISKSKLNIVDPDAMFERFGADTVRLYMLSDTPPERMQIWSEDGINGAWRITNRLWQLVTASLERVSPPEAPIPAELGDADRELRRRTHQAIGRITDAIEGGFQFNTAIARCNEVLNLLRGSFDAVQPAVLRETVEIVLRALSPIMPHLAEELWERLGHGESIFTAGWPEPDLEAAAEELLEIPVQVNGKVRARLHVSPGVPKEELERMALADERVQQYTEGKEIAKVVVVPGRLVSVAVRG